MKLSIITVNYNNRDGLQRTIDSVLGQTWRDFEWIIIDGGSTDGSRELIEQYQMNFAYWCSEPDKGVYNAMNKGIAKAKGEYLNFMNSGDVFYEKDTLKYVFRENLMADVVYGDWIEVNNNGLSFKKSPEKVTIDFFYSKNICHQAIFVKSIRLKIEGYDEDFQVYADWAKWIKLLLEGASFQYVAKTICKYDVRDGLSRRDYPKLQKEFEQMHKLVPPILRTVLDENVIYMKKMEELQQNPLLYNTLLLFEERPLYRRMIHVNLIVMKCLKRILDIVKI